jgi:predicted phage-related endonuclease
MSLDHELRRSGFTATDMAAVLGVDERRDLHALWAQKVGGLIPDPPTWRMRLGLYLERAVIGIYTDYVAKPVEPLFDKTYRHPKFPHVLATPDALVGTDGGVDAKTASWDQRHQWGETADDIPERVQLQALTCMEVMDRDYWDIALLSGDQFRVIRQERDREFGLFVCTEAEKVWSRYFETKEPPPIGGSKASAAWLQKAYPKHKRPDLRVATDEEIEELRRYGRLRAEQGALKKERDRLENWLKAAVKEREGLVWDGGRFTWSLCKDAHVPNWEALAQTLLTNHVRLKDGSGRDEETIAKLIEDHSYTKAGTRRVWFRSDESFGDEEEEAANAA